MNTIKNTNSTQPINMHPRGPAFSPKERREERRGGGAGGDF